MKHAVSSKKKASPLPRKGFAEPKKPVKKTAKSLVVESRQSNSAKPVSVKSKPTVAARAAQPKASVSKNKAAVKAVAADEKKVSPAAKPKTVAAKNNLKPNAVKIAPKLVEKSAKVSARKAKPATVAEPKKASKPLAAKIKPKTAEPVGKPPAGKTAPKIPAAQTTVKAPTAKTAKSKTVKPIEKVKKTDKKAAAISTKKVVASKATAKPAAKKTVQKSPNVKPTATKKVPRKPAQSKAQKSVKTINPAKPSKKVIVAKQPQPKPKTVKAKTIAAPKTAKSSAKKAKAGQTVKIRNGRIVLPPLKKVKAVETPVATPIETVETPAPKPRPRKIKAFGSAIFRGAKERYDFQVFPVDGEFEDAAAVFIISRRVVDRFDRAHHRMVCIGQTASVLKELKKHRKGKCFRDHQVNAVSVLREENEQKRQKIEADLKSAHRIPCPH